MGAKVEIVISGGIILIGKLAPNHGVYQMDDPRVVSGVQDQAGRISNQIGPILGHPKMIIFGREPDIHYEPVDQELLYRYTENVSGILMASKMPNM